MTSLFFKRDIAYCFSCVNGNTIRYQTVGWTRYIDIFHATNLSRYDRGYILFQLCRFGVSGLIDYFVAHLPPEFYNWDDGLIGATHGGHVRIIQQMVNLGARSLGDAAEQATTLPVLLAITAFDKSGLDLGMIDYAQVARNAVRRGTVDILRYALKRHAEWVAPRDTDTPSMIAQMADTYAAQLNYMLRESHHNEYSNRDEIIDVLNKALAGEF